MNDKRLRMTWIVLLGCAVLAVTGKVVAEPPEPPSPSDLRAPQVPRVPRERLSPSDLPLTPNLFEPAEIAGELAEEAEPIETDRDSFTPATTTTARGRVIVESAYSYLDNRNAKDTHSFPELLGRFGLTDRLELRLGWGYEAGGAPNTAAGGAGGHEFTEQSALERESQISYGLKYAVTDQEAWVPRSAFIVQGATPTFGLETSTQVTGTYVWGWTLDNGWTWDTSIRYAIDESGGDHFNLWAPSTVLKIPVHERWNAHVEYFGVFSQGRQRESNVQYFSPGIHYLVTPNLEVGIRTGWGLNDQSANFFSNAGFGWRF